MNEEEITAAVNADGYLHPILATELIRSIIEAGTRGIPIDGVGVLRLTEFDEPSRFRRSFCEETREMVAIHDKANPDKPADALLLINVVCGTDDDLARIVSTAIPISIAGMAVADADEFMGDMLLLNRVVKNLYENGGKGAATVSTPLVGAKPQTH